jgi:hypothetical protein
VAQDALVVRTREFPLLLLLPMVVTQRVTQISAEDVNVMAAEEAPTEIRGAMSKAAARVKNKLAITVERLDISRASARTGAPVEDQEGTEVTSEVEEAEAGAANPATRVVRRVTSLGSVPRVRV